MPDFVELEQDKDQDHPVQRSPGVLEPEPIGPRMDRTRPMTMSRTWEEPDEGAPVETPAPSDAPTGDEKTGEGAARKNQDEDPPA